MDRAVPILPSRDLDATARFYERLGFEQAGRHPDHLIMVRGTLELHFFAHREIEPATSSFMAYLKVADPDAWHEALAALDLPRSGIPRLVRIENKPGGTREFAVIDSDGTLLRIGCPLAAP